MKTILLDTSIDYTSWDISEARSIEMTDKTPFIVHCGECKHEWPAFYAPCNFVKAAEIMLHGRCPMCLAGPYKIFCCPAPVDELNTSSERVKKTGEI